LKRFYGRRGTTACEEEQMPPHDSGIWALDLAEGIGVAAQAGAVDVNTFPDL